MGHAASGRIASAQANGEAHFMAPGGQQPTHAGATIYCHSYPHAQCSLEVIGRSTLRLFHDMRSIPQHTYIEIALELMLDGELKRFRHPVHVLEKQADTAIVALSFEVEPELQEALDRLASQPQLHHLA